ncbi:MAG: hypothetical protein JW982_13880 [Spirochaetes bacterium]|nr:hypothetical protein [Spirochaetota bacterium]
MHDILLGVAGKPVFHSKSPVIFNSVFKKYNIDGAYFRILCNDEHKLFSIIRSLDMKGTNATSPLKEKIFSSLDDCDINALRSKSVNCIKNIDGKLKGFSTDHYGVITPLQKIINPENKKIVIAGAGGAARAAVSGLIDFSSDITLINRTESKAKDIAAEFNCSWISYENCSDILSECDILVSTLPAGISIPFMDKINKKAVLFDANYKKSLIEEFAVKNGMQFISGEKWLLNQAAPAFNIFLDGDITSIEADISSDITYDRDVIILTGFMCSGKTAAGTALAEKLGYQFADMDEIIENETGLSITEIFNKHGESYFRSAETELLKKLISQKKILISTGGGIILSEENRNLIKEKLCVWIFSDIKESIKRDNGSRPLLSGENKAEVAKKIFNERKKYYAECCSFMAYNDGKIEDLIRNVYEEISLI